MYNVYQYDRDNLHQQNELNNSRTAEVLAKTRKILSKKYAKQYNERVTQFIHSVAVNPVIINEHTSPIHIVPRPSDPKKFKGPHTIILKSFETEKQRIHEALEYNKIFDSNPLESPTELRPREKHKELKSRSKKKRIPIGDNNSSSYQVFAPKQDSSDESSRGSKASSDTYVSKQSGINDWVVESMKKTHFKAVSQKMIEEIGKNDVPTNLIDMSMLQRLPTKTLQPLLSKMKKSSIFMRAEKRPLSIQVLEECKIIRPKKSNCYLKKGHGHLMINPEKTNSEIAGNLAKTFCAWKSKKAKPVKLPKKLTRIQTVPIPNYLMQRFVKEKASV